MDNILPEFDTPFIGATEKYIELTEYLQSTKTSAKTHRELESFLSGSVRDLIRLLLEEHLNMRVPGNIWKSIIGSDGIKRSYKQLHSRKLITIFGKITRTPINYSHPGKSRLL